MQLGFATDQANGWRRETRPDHGRATRGGSHCRVANGFDFRVRRHAGRRALRLADCGLDVGDRGWTLWWRKRVSAPNIDITNLLAQVSSYPTFYPLKASRCGRPNSASRSALVCIVVAEASSRMTRCESSDW